MKDKFISKSRFPIVLGSSALLIALCAAAFSVYGIGSLIILIWKDWPKENLLKNLEKFMVTNIIILKLFMNILIKKW